MQPLHSRVPLPPIPIGHVESRRCGGSHRALKKSRKLLLYSSGAPAARASCCWAPRPSSNDEVRADGSALARVRIVK